MRGKNNAKTPNPHVFGAFVSVVLLIVMVDFLELV
jgi:hypothetical protein